MKVKGSSPELADQVVAIRLTRSEVGWLDEYRRRFGQTRSGLIRLVLCGIREREEEHRKEAADG